MLSLTNSLLRAPPVPIQLQVCRWPLEIDVARGNLALFRYAGWSALIPAHLLAAPPPSSAFTKKKLAHVYA